MENVMKADIYRVANRSSSSFLHEEVCRECAEKFHTLGYSIEFDSHLCKYTYEKNGELFYADGSDSEDESISCSLCGNVPVSKLSKLEYAE